MTGGNMYSSDGLIAKLIGEHPGREKYDDLITERNIHFFRHLSSLRENLLSWFPFEHCETVLEVGGGFGALTGMFARQFSRVDVIEQDPVRAEAIRLRYQERKNIRVIESGIEAFSAAEKYDAVILADLPADQSGSVGKLLEKLSSFVRDDGVILFGFCSKNGAKYLCGGLDHHVSAPFDTSGLCSKEEIDSILKCNFPYTKWYYPMPDDNFVQAVYTDKSDFSTLLDRVAPMDGYISPFVNDEKQMLLEFIRDGSITEHADYCLAEIRKEPKDNRITEVYLSADREEGRRYQVTLTDETVIKSALDTQSVQSLEQEYQNSQALKARGLKVVEEIFTGGVIRMPRIRHKSLISCIGDISSRDELTDLFDRLYSNSLLSSEETEKGILRTGYIDMIPFNIFCNEGDLTYYDQEFTVPNCEAAYIIFRALHYSWLHEPRLEEIIPLAEMKRRFSISDQKWEAYEKTENEFISRNRCYQALAQVYRWKVNISPEQIRRNQSRLLGYDPAAIRAIQQVQLDILKYFLEFCRKNGLACFALHGTMLGAVRYGGMIPWDDDIDIGMKREDYDRLISLFDNSKHAPYFLQTMYNNTNLFYGGYAKLRRDDTTMIERFNQYHGGCLGIGIDILPLDYCEEDFEKHIKKQKVISHLQRLLLAKRYPLNAGLIPDVPGQYVSLYYILSRLVPKNILMSLLEKCFRRKKRSSKRAILACYYKKSRNFSIFDERDLNDLTELPFEGMMIPVLKDSNRYLIYRFGPNYMADPTEHQPKHKDVFYDTTKSYKEL